MKKFLMFALTFVMLLPTIAFAGCNKSDTINMSRYFESKVTYQLFPNYSMSSDLTLKSFLDDKVDHQRSFYEIDFTGISSWLYKLQLSYITFDLYSNMDTDIEFNLTISNLHEGDQSAVGGNSVFTERVPVALKEGKKVHVKIDVNDYFESYSTTTKICLIVTDRSYFLDNGEDIGLKYDLLNFMLHGKHLDK